jgi:hypothetical protein
LHGLGIRIAGAEMHSTFDKYESNPVSSLGTHLQKSQAVSSELLELGILVEEYELNTAKLIGDALKMISSTIPLRTRRGGFAA